MSIVFRRSNSPAGLCTIFHIKDVLVALFNSLAFHFTMVVVARPTTHCPMLIDTLVPSSFIIVSKIFPPNDLSSTGMAKRKADGSKTEPFRKRRSQSLGLTHVVSASRTPSTDSPSASPQSPNPRRSPRLSGSPQQHNPTNGSTPARSRSMRSLSSSRDPELPDIDPSDLDNIGDEVNDSVLYRILSGLEYVHTQIASEQPIMQITRFSLSTQHPIHPGSALDIVRQAHHAGHATIISVSQSDEEPNEVYEIGIPRPDWVTEGELPGIHDPQWWFGKTTTEIKAGPHAGDADVRRAQTGLDGAETRRNRQTRTKKDIEVERKLTEGLRRQRHKLPMYGDDFEGQDGSDSDADVSGSTDSDSQEIAIPSSKSTLAAVSSSYEGFDSDDEPLMNIVRRRVTSSTRSPKQNTAHPQPSPSSGSDTYKPISSSANSSSSSNDESTKSRSRARKQDSTPLSSQKPATCTNNSTRSQNEQNQISESDTSMPMKQYIRHAPTNAMNKRSRPSMGHVEVSTDSFDEMDVVRQSRSGAGQGMSRRSRPVILESSESGEDDAMD